MRTAVFISMVPRSIASSEAVNARKSAVDQQTTTTHRPHVVSPTHAYTDWQIRVQHGDPAIYPDTATAMTAQRLRLIGYSAEEARMLTQDTDTDGDTVTKT